MMEETIFLILLCLMLYIIGWLSKMWPIAFMGALGWVIVSLRIFEEGQDYLTLGLMVFIAVAMVVTARDHEARRWQ